ncbi:MAG: type II secretion system F family protein [archaeon]
MGFSIAAVIMILDLIYFIGPGQTNMFLFLMGLALTVATLPFVINVNLNNKNNQEIADMFLEFSRNLAESVAAGTPISKSIVNMRSKNYGVLSPNIIKLSNQISVGIPLSMALQNFARDVDNEVITRAVTLISEAEKAGGEIDYILESSAKAIAEIEKLKKERKAAIYSIVAQGYIIFFIFIGIMLVIEFKILPLTANINAFGSVGNTDFATAGNGNFNSTSNARSNTKIDDLSSPLFYLLVAQGLFAGLVIGKVTEGTIKSGVKHSFILAVTALLTSTGANVLFSSGGA